LRRIGPFQEQLICGRVARVATDEPVGSERDELARSHARLGPPLRNLLLERRRLELVEELVDRCLVVAGAGQSLERGEELEELLGFVARAVRAAVVDEQDPPGLLLVDVHADDRKVLPAELPRGDQPVVSGEDLHRPAVDDERLILPVALEALLDRVEVTSARVLGVGAELGEADGRDLKLERLSAGTLYTNSLISTCWSNRKQTTLRSGGKPIRGHRSAVRLTSVVSAPK
jgi:hypothetical protein